MDIILIQDVTGLGYKNEVHTVKNGYARNFLLPQKFAILATPSAKKILAENQKQAAHKLQKVKDDAVALANSINGINLELKAKAGQNGKIFGSITTLQIAQNLKERGFEIDRRKITFPEEIKHLGKYTANVDLYREVKATINIDVTEEV